MKRLLLNALTALSLLLLVTFASLWPVSFSRGFFVSYGTNRHFAQVAIAQGHCRIACKSRPARASAVIAYGPRVDLNDSTPSARLRELWPEDLTLWSKGFRAETDALGEWGLWEYTIEGQEGADMHRLLNIPWTLQIMTGITHDDPELSKPARILELATPVWYAQVPLIWPILLLMLLPARSLCIHLTRWKIQRRADTRNLCPTCRYDLRAHQPILNSELRIPNSQLPPRCPECGTPIPTPSPTEPPAVPRV